MVGAFPNPLPDEFMYSIIARYHVRSGNRNFRQTNLDLFHYTSRQLSRLDLPNNLNQLVNNLPVLSKQSVENLLQNHTLYPFYVTFLAPLEAGKVKELMRKKINCSIFEIAKVALDSRDITKKFLKFCPLCFEEETQKYGEAYWHRIHQTPGVLVCPIHGVLLQDSLINADDLHCHAAASENCVVNNNSAVYTDSTMQKLLIFAKDIEWLMNNSLPFKDLHWLRNQYQNYLIKAGFMKVGSGKKITFDEEKFSNAVFDFYDRDFLEAVQPNLAIKPEKYFAHCLLACDINPVIDRVTHLLIIKFLADSLSSFFL